MMVLTLGLGGYTLAATPAPEALVGTYEMQLDVATMAKVPILGETLVRSRQVMIATIATIAAGSDGLWVTHDTCSLAAKTRPALADTSFPAAFIDAIPVKSYPLELSLEGDGWKAHMDLGALAIGFDPTGSPLPPKTVSEPAVVDWDSDGKPAATIHLKVPLFGKVEVYEVQTAHAILDGTVVSTSRVEGGARIVDFHQHILSASNRLFVQNPTLVNDPSRSSFRLLRVADNAGCADIPDARVE